jgi:isocitrate dehydrogenase
VKDWVKLAVKRARVSGQPTVFWLDDARAHDREIMAKVALFLPEHDINGLDIQTMAPLEAQIHSLAAVSNNNKYNPDPLIK